MDIGKQFQRARIAAQLSARDVAALADVATSTVTRFENGEREPSFGIAVRMLRAVDLDANLQRISRASAIGTARWLIDPQFGVRPDDADEWLDRWTRLGLLDSNQKPTDLRKLLYRAARSARLVARPWRTDFVLAEGWENLQDKLTENGIEWARTGDAAANRIVDWADETWPVFYVDDIYASRRAIGIAPRGPDERGPLMSLVQFDGYSEIGRWMDSDGTWYADAWQVVMDCLGGVQRMPEQADMIIDTLVETT
ncbi:helix-turn-helix transcriptional regulator [Myceligenerans crystallogenes]|uniref:HTH cro/C1-type domain-containing protein n=1 Tax=Myceligenerans crystallogenes TaxID=316335 RepID=A0ABN2NLY7_9MICO